MTISIEGAARYICQCGEWNVSHLALQKILYIAQLVHLGRTGQKLFNSDFEAWDYGPVSPQLYHKLKGYGSKPIPKTALWSASKDLDPVAERTLREACDHLVGRSPSDLIRNTHWAGGAWAKRYVPGANVGISEEDMLDEFRNRSERTPQAA